MISPGRLPNNVTVEKIIADVSYSVNPVLAKFMENLRYIDKLTGKRYTHGLSGS